MLDLYKKLESQEREKREKMDSKWISCLSLLYFFSFFPLSLSCQYSSFLTQEKQRRSFSCVYMLSENKKPFFFTYDFTRSYITQILEYFCQGQIACNGQLYFQLLWDAYSGTCDALSLLFSQGVPCSSVSPYFKTVHVHGGATGCQPSMAASFRMKRPTHCWQWDVQVLVSVDIYRSRKIRSPTVSQCTFLQRNLDLAGTSSPMVGWQPCRRPTTTCSRARRT